MVGPVLRRLAIGAGAVLCLGWPGGTAAEAEAGGPGRPLDVRVEDGLLSVDLDPGPLADVLEAIAEQTGAELVVQGDDLGEVRAQTFADTPLADGVRRLVEPHGVVMTFEPAEEAGGAPRLVALTVYGSAAASASVAGEGVGSAEPAVAAPPPGVQEFARGGDPAIAAALADVLTRDPDRRAALGFMVGASLGPPEEGPQVDPALHAALRADDPRARIEALRAIGAEGGDGAIGPLVEVLAGDREPAVRRAAVGILAGLDSEQAALALEGALDDPDAEVRAAAAQALGR